MSELNLRAPLAFFDLEATGTDIINDRIVEIAVIKLMPNGEEVTKVKRINPEMPIPEEVTKIHGITNEDVKDEPTFKQIAKSFHQFLQGCDLSGFNCVRFDVPMLVEEFLRADIQFDVSNRRIIDAQRIFHMMEPRTLEAAYRFYCDKTLENAHSAKADTRATLEVLKAQVKRYEGQKIKDKSGQMIEPVKNDMQALHELTMSNKVDLAGRMVYNDAGTAIFNFGKHKNKPVLEVLERDPSYYDWILSNNFPLDTKKKLTQLKLSQFNMR